MTFLELVDDRLVTASLGEPATLPVRQSALAAVRGQLVEVLGRPLLEVEWRELRDGWELVALEGTGRVVSVVLREELDAAGLITAMSRQADLARLSRSDLAQRYGGGPQAMAQHWGELRRALPAVVEPGASVTVLAASIAPDVRGSQSLLEASGVALYSVDVREMRLPHQAPRVMVQVVPLRDSAFALPDPVLIERNSRRRSAPGVATSPAPVAEVAEDTTPVALPVVSAPDPVAAPVAEAPAPAPVPASVSPVPTSEPPAATRPANAPSRVARRRLERPRDDATPRSVPAVSAASAAPPAPPAPTATAAPAPQPHVQATHTGASHRLAAPALSEQFTVPIGEESAQALARAARQIGLPTTLVWKSLRRGIDLQATLTTDGHIVLPDGRRFTDPSLAASAARGDALVGNVDGWRVWRLGAGGANLASLLA